MNANHYAAFKRLVAGHTEQAKVGRSIRRWAGNITKEPAILNELPEEQVSRKELIKLCQTACAEVCFCAVMAWGGMRADHARRSWACRKQWAPAVISFRGQVKSRREAFAALQGLRSNGHLPGVRPAFYTKLIFFMQPTLNGYIMDQWTAKSVNLLAEPIVHINSSGFVTDGNTPDHYERFCAFIDGIAKDFGLTGAQIEERMFSGPCRKGTWRAYVEKHWLPDKRFSSRPLNPEPG